MDIKIKVLISGKVQGVFFRFNTKKNADELGLSGWVKNTKDGKVEALFEGDEKDIYKMIEWCSKGPSNSKVTKVDVFKKKYVKEYNNFSIIY
jgi:acylphosphatase